MDQLIDPHIPTCAPAHPSPQFVLPPPSTARAPSPLAHLRRQPAARCRWLECRLEKPPTSMVAALSCLSDQPSPSPLLPSLLATTLKPPDPPSPPPRTAISSLPPHLRSPIGRPLTPLPSSSLAIPLDPRSHGTAPFFPELEAAARHTTSPLHGSQHSCNHPSAARRSHAIGPLLRHQRPCRWQPIVHHQSYSSSISTSLRSRCPPSSPPARAIHRIIGTHNPPSVPPLLLPSEMPTACPSDAARGRRLTHHRLLSTAQVPLLLLVTVGSTMATTSKRSSSSPTITRT